VSETWWHARWGDHIKPVVVERHTEQSVWIDGRRRARRSDGYLSMEGFFPTWSEARDALAKDAEEKVTDLRRQLEQANGRLGNIKGFKEPQSP
jgi:hypothetical protein